MSDAPAQAEAPASPAPRRLPVVAEVVATARLSPQMIRVTLSAPELRGFALGEFTDHYVKLQIPAPGSGVEPPFSPEELRRDLPRELRPRVRTYTVAGFDRDRGEIAIEFVCHGSEGVAGPWADSAVAGDRVQLVGPGGGYTPDPTADWHLLVGDLCVLPAIDAALARIPAGSTAITLIEVDGPEEQRELRTDAELDLRWFHRSATDADSPLIAAVRGLDLPAGDPQLFIHGEAGMVREVRRTLLVDRGLGGEHPSVSGYWKRRRTEEGWREDKPEWKRLVAADTAGPR